VQQKFSVLQNPFKKIWHLLLFPFFLRYELAHDPDGWLSVDENSGVLTVAKEFDQESSYVNNSLYTIIVHAIDHGK